MRHLLPNTVIAKDEKLHTAGLDYTVMSQVKISITTILHKKKLNAAIPKNPISPSLIYLVMTMTLTVNMAI